ncbi:HI_0552 family protein [Pasteurellaceae bacterium LIM206]|nr:HI_0552 family protein [Pasteurellaceae bacterium LIM206]
MLTAKSCDLFNIPFFQFSQLKKFCPEQIPQIKADYKQAWNTWKDTILQVYHRLGTPFAEPHIEKWCNGWQVRAHFFAYFKYEFNKNSAAILSVLLNRRRLSVSLDWHCYRADRSQITLHQYNQWLDAFDFQHFADFDIRRGDEDEYGDFRQVKQLQAKDLTLRSDEDFWCIGKNVERAELDHIDTVTFITQSIRDLLPLYEKCHYE